MQGRPPARTARLTHVDAKGRARMVDVGDKAVTRREATAAAEVRMKAETLRAIVGGRIPKGDVLAVARVAGILAAKRTHELVPMCHPLPITAVTVEIEPDEARRRLRIEATVRVDGKTGVEMEALTAASVAALTVYDMAKAIDRGMTIERVCLLAKSGGKSGDYRRGERR